MASKEIVAGQVERGVRREPPGESAVDLGADVAGITLGEAVAVDRDARRASHLAVADGEGWATGIRIDFLSRPRWGHHATHRQRRHDAVSRPERELAATAAVVADVGVHTLVGTAATVEVVDAEAEDPEPANPVRGVKVERLVRVLAARQ